MSQLKGKVAVVTGASKGIGAAIARALGEAGASVVVNFASSRDGADRVVKSIVEAGGKAIAVQGDVSKRADVTRLFAETKKAFGAVHVLVNNAGVYDFLPLEAVTEESFHRQYNVNVLGTLLATQEAVRHFGGEGGSVINLSSVVGSSALPMSSVYSGTKAAVDSITRVLAAELGAKKIRVNAVSPGLTETEGLSTMMPNALESEFATSTVAKTPLGRVGQPKDIASAVLFLASEEAAWVTGEVLRVSGGLR